MVNLIQTFDLDNENSKYDIEDLGKGVFKVQSGKSSAILEVLDIDIESKSMTVRHQHTVYDLEFKNELDLVLDQMGIKLSSETISTDVKAPMPGKVIDIVVKPGDKLQKGDAILILEAMKMENVLKAEGDCSIKKVLVASSESVEKNQVLVEFDA